MSDHRNLEQTNAQKFVAQYARESQNIISQNSCKAVFEKLFSKHQGVTRGNILEGVPKQKTGIRYLFGDDSFCDIYFAMPGKMFCGVAGSKDIKDGAKAFTND